MLTERTLENLERICQELSSARNSDDKIGAIRNIRDPMGFGLKEAHIYITRYWDDNLVDHVRQDLEERFGLKNSKRRLLETPSFVFRVKDPDFTEEQADQFIREVSVLLSEFKKTGG
ncbi:MAG: hypothetical protein HYT12_03920 [Candidatus Liptonbacteria bacterium]|nr:hypothetical protein [Candidatus Liptonbacteria bacterium]